MSKIYLSELADRFEGTGECWVCGKKTTDIGAGQFYRVHDYVLCQEHYYRLSRTILIVNPGLTKRGLRPALNDLKKVHKTTQRGKRIKKGKRKKAKGPSR